MSPKPSPWLALSLLAAVALMADARAFAANSAPSIAAGGLVPRRDSRIAVAKEVVRISDRKVVVDYDLRNDTDADITTDLGFPVPPYQNQWDAMDPATQAFRSLRIWADDKPVKYLSEAKAELDGLDITKTLEKAHIDIASFGHLDLGRNQHTSTRPVFVEDYERLTQKEKHRLRSEGIFKGAEGYCLYTVHLLYYWPQTVPAHSTVHIRQEYVPVVGFAQAPPQADALQAAMMPPARPAGAGPGAAPSDDKNPLGGFCADSSLVHTMLQAQKAFSQSWGPGILPYWIDYDLLSANEWHKPIEDFTLIVDIPQPERGERTLVSFCSPGVVDRNDSDHPQVHLTKFVPAISLHIGFFNAPLEPSGAPVAAR
jgi:hypothetical protein